jgi:murein hydrolase activator
VLRRFLIVSLACLAWGGAPALRAAPAQDIGERQADLDEVKTRLKQLQKEISETEQDRSSAAEALAKAEQAFSAATRKSRDLAQSRQEIEQELQRLETEQRALDARVAARQKDLGAWLRHYYTHDQGERMARLFDSGDPNQLARNAYYMERAGAAHRQVLDGLRADLQDKGRIADEVREHQEQLAEFEEAQQRERETLEKLQAERKAALAAVSAQLSTQRQAAAELQRDEERLAQLIAGLQRIAREQAAKAAAKAAAEARAAAEAEARRRATEAAARQAPASPNARVRAQGAAQAATPGQTREEPVVGRAEAVATPAVAPAASTFAQLQGRLPVPLRGELIGRFGAARAGGGTSWKGVFIRADAGTEVRAVAAGEVVFADWLRGFGNLVVVDHGGDFLTIYGNNDALLRTNGERVVGGEALARVGSSGGAGESGLYFEIRRQGQALDPLKWIRWQ